MRCFRSKQRVSTTFRRYLKVQTTCKNQNVFDSSFERNHYMKPTQTMSRIYHSVASSLMFPTKWVAFHDALFDSLTAAPPCCSLLHTLQHKQRILPSQLRGKEAFKTFRGRKWERPVSEEDADFHGSKTCGISLFQISKWAASPFSTCYTPSKGVKWTLEHLESLIANGPNLSIIHRQTKIFLFPAICFGGSDVFLVDTSTSHQTIVTTCIVCRDPTMKSNHAYDGGEYFMPFMHQPTGVSFFSDCCSSQRMSSNLLHEKCLKHARCRGFIILLMEEILHQLGM